MVRTVQSNIDHRSTRYGPAEKHLTNKIITVASKGEPKTHAYSSQISLAT